MNKEELKIFIKLLMTNDNNPDMEKEEMDTMRWLANYWAIELGFEDWTDAYHKL